MRHDPRQQQARPPHVKQEQRAGNDDDEKAKVDLPIYRFKD
jgi:hypothetical protein